MKHLGTKSAQADIATQADITALTTAVGLKANTASPSFTGTPATTNLKFGNVASADVNTLDHYEEGTFTPTLEAAGTAGTITYGTRSGTYTRIGDRVYWSAIITLSGITGASGGLRLGGLPFVVSSGSANNGGISVGFFSGLAATDVVNIAGIHTNAASYITLYKAVAAGGAGLSSLGAADISNTFQIRVSGVYKAS